MYAAAEPQRYVDTEKGRLLFDKVGGRWHVLPQGGFQMSEVIQPQPQMQMQTDSNTPYSSLELDPTRSYKPIPPNAPPQGESLPQGPQPQATSGVQGAAKALLDKWVNAPQTDAAPGAEMGTATGVEGMDEQRQYEGQKRKALYWGALSEVPGTGRMAADDLLTPQERAFIKRTVGLELPMGYKRSQFQQVFGRSGVGGYGMTPYQELQQGLARDRLDFYRQESEARQGRFEENLGLKKFQQQRLPNTVSSLALDLNSSLKRLQDIEDKFDTFKDEIGVLPGNWNALLMKFGLGSEVPSALNGTLVGIAGQYIKSLAGSRFSDKDLSFFLQSVPQISQNPEQFMGLLKNMKEQLLNHAMRAKSVYASQGFNTAPFDQALEIGRAKQTGNVSAPLEAPSVEMTGGQSWKGLNAPTGRGMVTITARNAQGDTATRSVRKEDAERMIEEIKQRGFGEVEVR